MLALLLPSSDMESSKRIADSIKSKGHWCIIPADKDEFFFNFKNSDVIIAAGELTDLGIWLWGYAYARQKRVIAFSGVSPSMSSRVVSEDNYLSNLPEQLALFK